MLKSERFSYINEAIKARGIVTVREIIDACGVSDMTVRRDLSELEHEGQLVRVHGGAQRIDYSLEHELSHVEKASVEESEKLAIAREAAQLVEDQDVLFLGPGTTVEMLARQLQGRDLSVVTTSHPVFMTLYNDPTVRLFLIGGQYRPKTESFIGELACERVRSFNFTKTFISCNGIFGDEIMSYSSAEGSIQKEALNNAHHRYLLADHTKFNRKDFYTYYRLQDFDACITDDRIDPVVLSAAEQRTQVIVAGIEHD